MLEKSANFNREFRLQKGHPQFRWYMADDVLQVQTCKHWYLEQTILINLFNLQQQEVSAQQQVN